MIVNHSTQSDTYVSTRVAADMLDVSLRTIQLWVESGTLKAWKTAGGHRKVSLQSIEDILQQRQDALDLDRKDEKNVIRHSQPGAEFRILLVEDDEGIKQLFRFFFTNWQHPVTLDTASDGFEGLVKLTREQPDLLITDISMPGIDGYDMLRFLGRSEQFKSLNIAVITGLSPEKLQEYGPLPKGVQLFFKPVRFETLEPLILSLIAAKQGTHVATGDN